MDNQFNNTNNPENNQERQNNTYANPYSNYQPNFSMPEFQPNPPKKEKKKGTMGAVVGKAAVAALVFALIAAPVFTGISYGLNKIVGAVAPVTDNQNKTNNNKIEDVEQDKTVNAEPIGSTGTSQIAGDLTDVSAIVDEVMPSIVAITNTGTASYESYWGTQSYESTSCGSGIIIAQDDDNIYIISNNHVVENASKLTVQFFDEASVTAEIKGTDAADDLAVIKVERKNIPSETLEKIRIASIADSTKIKVGSAAIAIGNALGYGQSVTTGVISALNRSVTVSDNGTNIIHNNLIQTDAAINPGNSGGALLDATGKVIGINSVKYTDTDVEGIGYAIPISDAMVIAERLITREKVDEANAAYLGIQGRDVTSSMASAYDWPIGVYVVETISGQAASKSGIKNRDIITAINNVPVTTMTQLKNELSYYEAGETVTITLQRANGDTFETKEIEVKLGSVADAGTSSRK